MALCQAASLQSALPRDEAPSWSPAEAASCVGAVLRQRALLPALPFSQFHLEGSAASGDEVATVASSPSGRSRRSAAASAGRRSVLQGAPPAASPGGGQSPRSAPLSRKRQKAFDEIDALTPSMLRAVAKRLYSEKAGAAGDGGYPAPMGSPVGGAAGGGAKGVESATTPVASALAAGLAAQSPVARLPPLSPLVSPGAPAPPAAEREAARRDGCGSPVVAAGGGRPYSPVDVGGGVGLAGVTLLEADVTHLGALAPPSSLWARGGLTSLNGRPA